MSLASLIHRPKAEKDVGDLKWSPLMRLSIRLYSSIPSLVEPEIVRSCVALLDFRKLVVSRTLGPANYYEINKRSFEGANVSFPPKDINFQDYYDVEAVCALLRDGSVLTISYWGSRSERWGEITRGISGYASGTSDFFSSDSGFTFGPFDICDFFENEEGQDDVRLVDVSQFSYFLSCDDYRGDLAILRESLLEAEPFTRFRRELEMITGPLKLHLSV
jgi:hypothetical protein